MGSLNRRVSYRQMLAISLESDKQKRNADRLWSKKRRNQSAMTTKSKNAR